MKISFNQPYLSGRELEYIADALKRKHISGNGHYTRICHQLLEERYSFRKVLLTTSCTDALEMAALLLDLQPGDEVIVPSFTFVSTANPFFLRGAKIIFADSSSQTPNLDIQEIRSLITPETRAIVVMHYAGIACPMAEIMDLATEFGLLVVEDAAQAIDSFYKGKPLGSIGHLGCFSFHETKNITCGEGGMLVINDERFLARAEILWEKGTNRAAFSRGEVAKYEWIDVGSSFLPSDLNAAFLYGQLQNLERIQARRKDIWQYYYQELSRLQVPGLALPFIPDYATNNAHMFYLLCPTPEIRTALLAYLNAADIMAIFHYLPLHASAFFKAKHDGRELEKASWFADRVVRLPFYYDLKTKEQDYIITHIKKFFQPDK